MRTGTLNSGETCTYLSCAETAKVVRRALKEKFPEVKFSVRSDTYSGGASIRVRWTNGPTSKQVEAVTDIYKGAGFDGMIDLKYYRYHWLLPDGTIVLAHDQGSAASGGVDPEVIIEKPHPEAKRIQFGADFIFPERKWSNCEALREKIGREICADYGLPYTGLDFYSDKINGWLSWQVNQRLFALEMPPYKAAGKEK